MQNAASKLMALGALLIAAASCGKKADNGEAAENLLREASAQIEQGNYDRGTTLLDSLDSAFADQTDIRRRANALRPKIVEGKTAQEIADTQAELQYLTAYIDSISQEFNQVPASDEVFEPYSVHKDVSTGWRDRNTAISRLTPSGEFIVISSLAGNSTHHTALRLTSADGVSVTSGEVAYGGVENGAPQLSRESVRFPSAQADTLGFFAMQMDGRGPLTLEFVGGKSAPKARLSEKEVHAMASTYRAAEAIRAANATSARLERLKAKLQLARDQSSRLDNQNR